MRLGWGHDNGAFFFSRPDAARQECCEPGFTLLCMGLFSRFFVQALPCTAEGTVCRVGDTRSLVPRAYGTNRSSSNTSCSRRDEVVCETDAPMPFQMHANGTGSCSIISVPGSTVTKRSSGVSSESASSRGVQLSGFPCSRVILTLPHRHPHGVVLTHGSSPYSFDPTHQAR
jgi:hypothetical protein